VLKRDELRVDAPVSKGGGHDLAGEAFADADDGVFGSIRDLVDDLGGGRKGRKLK
jgi:hypothetical protein